MKQIILLGVALSFFFLAFSQQYKTAIGVKGGYSFFGGAFINAKHFLSGSTAVEGSLGGNSNFFRVQGMYERNATLTSDFEWYWGAGADLGVFTTKFNHTSNGVIKTYSGLFGGFNGLLGAEYTFSDYPINLAFDMGPTLRLFPYIGFGWTAAMAARFTIK